MENPAYGYPGLFLWDPETWKDRASPIAPLARWIQQVNDVTVRRTARTGRYDGRTDGTYTAKTRSNTYDDVVAGWRRRGIEYVTNEMGQVTWIAMIPEGSAGRTGQRMLVVLHGADYSDPNWAMEALDLYSPTLERAGAEGVAVLLVSPDGIDESQIWINILQEVSVRFDLRLERVHLDVSALERAGARLADVPGFDYRDLDGEPVADPDSRIESVAGVAALDITGRWQNHVSHLYENAIADRYQSPDVHLQHIVHSEAGKRMAEGMALELAYRDPADPSFLAHWESIGTRYESHDHAGQQWVSLTPLAAEAPGAEPLPVVLVFQEATFLSPFQAVTALSSYLQYTELVAQGELMLIVFALESPDDNDLAIEILHDAFETYPIDRTRVYVTGHSHNGHYAMEFSRRHHREVAATASLGNAYGLPSPAYSHEHVPVTDEMVELMSTIDLPVIDICGYSESDFVFHDSDTEAFADAVDSWRRRAYAFHLPPRTAEELAAVKTDGDEVARRIGVPADDSNVEYRMGGRAWIGDHLTVDGRLRLRLVALEHFPHMVAPQMPSLSWDFLRRFARDLETGEVVELS